MQNKTIFFNAKYNNGKFNNLKITEKLRHKPYC